MFRRIDAAIVNSLEKVTHWIERRTGKSNFFLASVVSAILIVLLIGMGTCLRYGLIENKTQSVIVLFITRHPLISSLFVVCLLGIIITSRSGEEKARALIAEGFSHTTRNSSYNRFVRMFGLFYVVFHITVIGSLYIITFVLKANPTPSFALFLFDFLYFFFSTLFLYLIACDPLANNAPETSQKQ